MPSVDSQTQEERPNRRASDRLPPDAAVLAAIGQLPGESRNALLPWLKNVIAGELERHGSEILLTRERAILARDLHDEVGADLAAAVALFKYHHDLRARDRDSGEILDRVFEILEGTLASVRTMIRTLRGPDLGAEGLLSSLDAIADEFGARQGLSVELVHSGNADHLSVHEQQVIFHVVREALANVTRHSGSPACTVAIDFAARPFVVVIADEGSGFDELPGSGFGLIGMKERAAGIDGRLEVISSPGRGTTVYLFGPRHTGPL